MVVMIMIMIMIVVVRNDDDDDDDDDDDGGVQNAGPRVPSHKSHNASNTIPQCTIL